MRGKMVLQSRDSDESLPKYAALHRYAPDHGRNNSQEWDAACGTPWTSSIKEVIDKEGRSARTEWTFQAT